jgi:hypothetical protein
MLVAFKTEQFMDIMETIREQVEGNRIILYMKGSPNQPSAASLHAPCRPSCLAGSDSPMSTC